MQPVLNIWIDLMTACSIFFFLILWILFWLEAIQYVMLPIRLGYRVKLQEHCSFLASLFSLQSLSPQQLVSSTEKSQVRLHHVSFLLLCKRQYVSWIRLSRSSCGTWPRALLISHGLRRGSLVLLTVECWRGARKKTILPRSYGNVLFIMHRCFYELQQTVNTEGNIISTPMLWWRETPCPKFTEWKATELHMRKKYCWD